MPEIGFDTDTDTSIARTQCKNLFIEHACFKHVVIILVAQHSKFWYVNQRFKISVLENPIIFKFRLEACRICVLSVMVTLVI